MTGSLTAEPESRWIVPASQSRSRDSLARILDATERLLEKRSFRDITVSEIARAAKTSPTAVYARFENKHALLGALFDRYAIAKRERVATFLDLDRLRDLPLSLTLRGVFPEIVAGYRQKQSLIRAFLDHASEDARFREAWAELGEFIMSRVATLVSARAFEVQHPEPERGLRHCMPMVFASLAHQIQFHGIDRPEMVEFTEALIQMVFRFMGIADVPMVGASDNS
jgi:AcrR family transcriptional regulator